VSTKLYDPAAIVVTIGPNLLSGFGEGTFVKVSRDEDAFMKKVGVDGEVARARNRNRSGTVEITLLQTSQSNDVLSALAVADELTGTGAAPLMIKDLFGTTLCMVPNAWVKKRADVEFGKEVADRSWVLDCDQIQHFVGGANQGP
jgi:hypothetical protein